MGNSGMKGALGRALSGLRRIVTRRDSTAFPDSWLELLDWRSEHYRRLPPEYQERFRKQLQRFLSEKRISGVEMDVTEEMELLVGASAVTLTCGWPDYEWSELREVLLYPDTFDENYNFGDADRAGIADYWGIVILTVPVLQRSFDVSSDALHVGFHEFAHLLDLDQSIIDGTPPYLTDDSIRWWMKLVEQEANRYARGDSILRPYAFSDPREFFPTAVEAFFQTPVALAERHDQLYGFLSSYFAQDPASWSQAAGT